MVPATTKNNAGLLITMKPYTTTYGTVIAPGILRAVKADILGGVDYDKTLNDYLRDPIGVHEDDYEEANEVYNHVESIIADEEVSGEVLAS